MDKKGIGLMALVVMASLLLIATPVAAATWQQTANKLGTLLQQIFNFIFNTSGGFSDVLFFYILPALLVYSILFDFIFLMGFFRRKTAMIISAIFALFGIRSGIHIQVVKLIETFLGTDRTGGIFIPMLTFMFIMMLIWWVLGHIIWGYRFANNIKDQENAMDYLKEIGTHLDAQTKKTGGI